MKIQLICTSYPPEIVGASIRFHSFAKYLGKFGHSTYIITKNKKGMILTKDNDFSTPKNCRVFRNPGFNIPLTPPDTGYIPSFLKRSLAVSKKYHTDIIHGSTPTIASGIVAYMTHKITKKPYIFGIRDPWIRAAEIDINVYNNAFITPNTFIGSIYKKIQEKILNNAEAIITTNPAIMEETQKVYPKIPKEKFSVIYNAADLDDFKNITPKKFKKFTILYTGVMYKSRIIDKLIDAVAMTDDVQLLMSGGGPKKEMKEFQDTIKKRSLSSRIKYLGVLENKELYKHYKGADLLFAGLKITKATKYLLPSKLFNYMASGNPVLATGPKDGDLDKTIRKYKCGIVLNSNDPKEISEAIYKLKDKKSSQLGKNGRKAVEKEFNREKQAKKLEKIYKTITST